jgi:hypothetical protein
MTAPVVLAELFTRHTRRHMPTRRVALGTAYLPMTGGAYGALLLGAVVHHNRDALDDDQYDDVPALLHAAAGGLQVPGIALRYRLQTDSHGLDRSRHRVVESNGIVIVELDVHGAMVPQILGAVLGASQLPPTPRVAALLAVRRAIEGHFRYPSGVLIRRIEQGIPDEEPWAPGVTWKRGRPSAEQRWDGIASDRRWAMEVLGLLPEVDLLRDDVNRRFRRLLRDAHPDSGGGREQAAERIAELSEARDLLLLDVDEDDDASAVVSAGE